MEDDLNRLDIGGHDDELADTSVEGLGGFVGTKCQLCYTTSEDSELTPSSTACSEKPAG